MSILDIVYMSAMPLGYLSSILDTWRIIKTRSAKSRSITAYFLGLFLVSLTLSRAIFSVHDLLFTVNAIALLSLNSFQLGCIIKWRRQ